jgi:hypothetical protein
MFDDLYKFRIALTLDDLYMLCIRVTFTPTVEHCSMATVIGLCIRVKLIRSLPPRYKVRYRCRDCGKVFIIRLFARAIRFLYADIMACTHVYQVLVIWVFSSSKGKISQPVCTATGNIRFQFCFTADLFQAGAHSLTPPHSFHRYMTSLKNS